MVSANVDLSEVGSLASARLLAARVRFALSLRGTEDGRAQCEVAGALKHAVEFFEGVLRGLADVERLEVDGNTADFVGQYDIAAGASPSTMEGADPEGQEGLYDQFFRALRDTCIALSESREVDADGVERLEAFFGGLHEYTDHRLNTATKRSSEPLLLNYLHSGR